MKNLIIQFGVFLVLCSLTLQLVGTPMLAFAAENGEPKVTPAPSSLNVGKYLTAEGQKQVTSIGQYIVRFINFLALAIGSFAFTAIVIGGIILVTSAGSEASLQKGKAIIKYAIIGLVIALAAYYITSFVQSIFYEYES